MYGDNAMSISPQVEIHRTYKRWRNFTSVQTKLKLQYGFKIDLAGYFSNPAKNDGVLD